MILQFLIHLPLTRFNFSIFIFILLFKHFTAGITINIKNDHKAFAHINFIRNYLFKRTYKKTHKSILSETFKTTTCLIPTYCNAAFVLYYRFRVVSLFFISLIIWSMFYFASKTTF